MGLLFSLKRNNRSFRGALYRSPLLPFTPHYALLIFLFLLLHGFLAAQVSLNEQKLKIPRQNTTLYEALNILSRQTGFDFIYNSETVGSNTRVRLFADNDPLGKVLENLLSVHRLSYKMIGNHILIYRPAEDAFQSPDEGTVIKKDTLRELLIKGHIYDDQTKAPIPFATVGITEQNMGTTTNYDGYFQLRIPSTLAEKSLQVAHLGYLNRSLPLRLLDRQKVAIYLERRVISIQEVIIRYVDPQLLVEKALEKRRDNYPKDPAYLLTFYREGVQKNQRHISYSEAVFKVYKSPFNHSEYSDQVKLLKSRKITDTNPHDTVFLKLKAGVQAALQLDIIKSLPGFMDLSPPHEYKYRYSSMISYGDRDAYAIGFEQVQGLQKALYTGTLYIDKENMAILGAEFEIDPKYISMAANDLVLRKSPSLVVRLEKISYSVSYMPFNGRYYLRHARCDIRLKTRQRRHLNWDRFGTYLELVTCRIDTNNVTKFQRQETLKPQVIFADQFYRNDDGFWDDFNIITPETELVESLSKIIGKIEAIE